MQYKQVRTFGDWGEMGGITFYRTFTYAVMERDPVPCTVDGVEVNLDLPEDHFTPPPPPVE